MPSRFRQFLLVSASLLLANALPLTACAQNIETGKLPEETLRPPKTFPPITEKLVGPVVVEPQHRGESTFPAEAIACQEPLCGGWLSSFSIGVRNWLSWGESESSFSGRVSPLSELRWRNLVCESVEFGASALLWDRLLLMGNIGTGVIGNGQLTDDDFALNDSQGLVSRSTSPTLNTNMHYFNVDVGWRLWESSCGPKCFFDVLIGYQYWRERYVAVGGVQVIAVDDFPVPAGTPFETTLGISEKYTWQALRVGAQGGIQISPCCAFKSQVVLLPVTQFENEDIHYSRGLIATDSGTGGFGVMADFKFTWCPCKGLFAEAGYRIWDIESGSGKTTEFFIDDRTPQRAPNTVQLPFNGASTLRQGLLLSVGYQW